MEELNAEGDRVIGYVVAASDGLWDVLTFEELGEWLFPSLKTIPDKSSNELEQARGEERIQSSSRDDREGAAPLGQQLAALALTRGIFDTHADSQTDRNLCM